MWTVWRKRPWLWGRVIALGAEGETLDDYAVSGMVLAKTGGAIRVEIEGDGAEVTASAKPALYAKLRPGHRVLLLPHSMMTL